MILLVNWGGLPSVTNDLGYMRIALALARRGLGAVWPNPAVGCVLVRDGRVAGRGWTAQGGRPHAETLALAQAGEAAHGAAAYVTLEPCSHFGKTPPCADALVKAGIVRAVVAIEDPDPRVSGRGIRRLRDAGIAVEVGLCAAEASDLNDGFLRRIHEGRPQITLKVASSLDGRIATHLGESQWITGPEARAAGHRLRAMADAILIGSTTAITDDPELTCRLPGLTGRSPLRLVVDSRLRLPLTANLVATARRVPTWILTRTGNRPERVRAFEESGVQVIPLPPGPGDMIDLKVALTELGRRGLTRILVEGGAHLSAALLQKNLVDRIAWFRAPFPIGGDGIPASVSFGVDHLEDAPRFRRRSVTTFGNDIFEYLTRE